MLGGLKADGFSQHAFGHLGQLDMADNDAGPADGGDGGVGLDPRALQQRLEGGGDPGLVHDDAVPDGIVRAWARQRL